MYNKRFILYFFILTLPFTFSLCILSDQSTSFYQTAVDNALDSWTLAQSVTENPSNNQNNLEMLGCLLKMYAALLLEYEQSNTHILSDIEFWQHINKQISQHQKIINDHDHITAQGMHIILNYMHTLLQSLAK